MSIKTPDNICLVTPSTPLKITGFKGGENNDIFYSATFQKYLSFIFEEPLDSLSALGVFIADKILEDREEISNIENIIYKIISLPFENKVLLMPILHSCI